MSRLYAARNSNLSLAWAEVLLKLLERGVNKLSPVVVTIGEFDAASLPVEHVAVRKALDTIIDQPCHTVASTIFPNSLWLPAAQDDAQRLYERYEKVWPRIAKHHSNRNGVYFRRLTAYSPKAQDAGNTPVNQLRHIIDTYRGGNHRHSALQASVFDPTRDHTNAPLRGFPCLQQVAFGVDDGRLEVTGFYALQHHISKAYGNYLGLCWLGRFMAKQMGVTLSQVTCVASLLKLGDEYTKTSLEPLRNVVSPLLEQTRAA
jgi:hypothetical protein